MHILHINNGFVGSKVHANLIKELSSFGVEQTVYCPVRCQNHIGMNSFTANFVNLIYSNCIKKWHRFTYNIKSHQLFVDLKKNVDLSKIDIIHAATLFSDGALAYKAYKKFDIPYVIAIRSVDTCDFIGHKMYHTWHLGRNIIKHAKFIYFISQAGLNQFSSSEFAKPLMKEIKDKMILRPNGIDEFWINNISYQERKGMTICYIGTFMKRKNVNRLIQAIKELRREDTFKDLRLRIIGGGYSEDGSTNQLVVDNSDFIDFVENVRDKKIIKEYMRKCFLFAMPSFTETFGLVYIEALSQNLPVVFTKEDGIDGLFDKSIGVGVNPYSIEEIKEAIKSICINRARYGNYSIDFNQFSWANIALKYYKDYKLLTR